MIFNYNENPLHTNVTLDEIDKKLLFQKIKNDALENSIFHATMALGVFMEDQDIPKAIKILSDADERAEQEANRLIKFYVDELEYGIHSGNCTCFASGCPRCSAEEFMEIDTIKGLSKYSAHKIDYAFRQHKTLKGALEYLKNYDPTPKDPEKWVNGYTQYQDRWRSEAKDAYDYLLKHAQDHFPKILSE